MSADPAAITYVVGPHRDVRFNLHHRQPRADKLDEAQRRICRVDFAFRDALRGRVADGARFDAFIAGMPFYIALEQPCARCGDLRKRTRDRACYGCHLKRGKENFDRIRAGIAPVTTRSKDSHLDLLQRQRKERAGDRVEHIFDGLIARSYPTGRLEIVYPDGEHEHDLNTRTPLEIKNAATWYPQLRDALEWAGWTLWPIG